MHIITIIRIRKQRDEAQEELTYINARKSIIDVNPHISSQNVMNDKTYSGLRIMEHISKAIETMIDMISTAMEVKSVVYLVHDKKDGFLYPELGVSDEEKVGKFVWVATGWNFLDVIVLELKYMDLVHILHALENV